MATATVKLIYDGNKESREVTIQSVRSGPSVLDHIDRKIEKEYKDDNWIR